jgi:hypothetical protein
MANHLASELVRMQNIVRELEASMMDHDDLPPAAREICVELVSRVDRSLRIARSWSEGGRGDGGQPAPRTGVKRRQVHCPSISRRQSGGGGGSRAVRGWLTTTRRVMQEGGAQRSEAGARDVGAGLRRGDGRRLQLEEVRPEGDPRRQVPQVSTSPLTIWKKYERALLGGGGGV